MNQDVFALPGLRVRRCFPSLAQLTAQGAMNCPKCNSIMHESSRDSMEIAECYFCGFRLVSDEQPAQPGAVEVTTLAII
jgi:hypothetical protein